MNGRIEECVLPTPERIAKGGLKLHFKDGLYRSCQLIDGSVLADLIESEGLEEYHRAYADAFLELHEAYWSRLGYKGNFLLFVERGGRTGERAAEFYTAVCRDLGKAAIRCILHGAVDHQLGYPDYRAGKGVYLAAFRELVKTMDHIRKLGSDAF